LQPVEPAYDRSAGHAHISSDLRYRKWFALDIPNGHACSDEKSFQARAKGLAKWRVSAMQGPQEINHKTAEHHSLWRFLDLALTILRQFLTPSFAQWQLPHRALCTNSREGGL
jgi:hypothetical protein